MALYKELEIAQLLTTGTHSVWKHLDCFLLLLLVVCALVRAERAASEGVGDKVRR